MVGLLAFVNPFIVLADAGVSIPFKYNQFYIPMFFSCFHTHFHIVGFMHWHFSVSVSRVT